MDAVTGAKQILQDAGFSITPLIRREATHHNLSNFIALRTSALD
jgi:hypothetical protein